VEAPFDPPLFGLSENPQAAIVGGAEEDEIEAGHCFRQAVCLFTTCPYFCQQRACRHLVGATPSWPLRTSSWPSRTSSWLSLIYLLSLLSILFSVAFRVFRPRAERLQKPARRGAALHSRWAQRVVEPLRRRPHHRLDSPVLLGVQCALRLAASVCPARIIHALMWGPARASAPRLDD
jgi:hypothetical protein